MIEAFLLGVSVLGPGLANWTEARPILAGERDYAPAPVQIAPPTILSANERRRTGLAVRLALNVAQGASEMADVAPGAIQSLFATSNGDGQVVHTILETMAAGGPVSPTQFHNSVHNAAAGYWSIATGSRRTASCLAAHDVTAAAGLLEAMAAQAVEREPILLCVYDTPMPAPLAAKRSTSTIFGAGLVLAPKPGPSALARLTVDWRTGPAAREEEAPRAPALRELAASNPAARLLRLLEAVARAGASGEDRIALALLEGRLEVTVRSCSTGRASSP